MLESAWSQVTEVRVDGYLEKPAAEAAVAAAALALARISQDLDVLGKVGLSGVIPDIECADARKGGVSAGAGPGERLGIVQAMDRRRCR
jgi:hypothetical protein